ncbi:hypothetical protein FE257_010835 [Aspergillus nanangensis]|uniref:Uncharacterized protein n=1 Tax=Aspergillus nanangensis TaxID=2582783 RepID=A0AAD4CXC0_ASPNN|nr:hypothetical protein FE257_010835 [Aspergillus nanangensis]
MANVTKAPLDNKSGPLQVPGLHGLPINVLLPHNQFATGVDDWKAPILTVKELAILHLINNITDRPHWNRAIFDQNVIAQWREDALASSSLMNDKTWDWCLQELQDKARQFDRDGGLVVLNTASGVCKSDTTISSTVKSQLSRSVDALSRQAMQPKPELGVVNLVDPSLFPLVYGRTKILNKGQMCGMDANSWSSCNEDDDQILSDQPRVVENGPDWSWDAGRCIWSSKFQWMPCEVEFTGPPGSTDIHISSYINNLHPTNTEIYSAIEAVISGSIKQWNEVLVRNKWKVPSYQTDLAHGCLLPCHREPIRIRTYGVEWKAQFPEWAKKLPPKKDESKLSAEEYESMCTQVEAYLQEPESPDAVLWQKVQTQTIPRDWKVRWGLLRTALTKYGHTFVFEHSDPATAYSYDDWKAGRTQKAIVGPSDGEYACHPEYEHCQFMEANPWLAPYEWMYMPKKQDVVDHEFYTITLQDEFREQGLQVVVRIHSIELDPETPSFPGEEWHIEGNANERIVANTIYAFDIKNMSEPQISVRQRFRGPGRNWVYDRHGAVDFEDPDLDEDDEYSFSNAFWDIEYIGKLFGVEKNFRYSPQWQQLGEVKMPQGRLISLPNAFQHRIGPVEIQDKSKPGYCRFLTLSLVDPTYRLCSTRNVLPQQTNWVRGNAAEPATQISLAEALKLREELVQEHVKKEEGVWKQARYVYFSGWS